MEYKATLIESLNNDIKLFFIYFHSAINPILYNAMSNKFRKAFRHNLSCGKLSEPPHNHIYCYNNQDHSRLSHCAVQNNTPSSCTTLTHASTTRVSVSQRHGSSHFCPGTSTAITTGHNHLKHRSSAPASHTVTAVEVTINHLTPDWHVTKAGSGGGGNSPMGCGSNVVDCGSSSNNKVNTRVSVATQAGGSSRLGGNNHAGKSPATSCTKTKSPATKISANNHNSKIAQNHESIVSMSTTTASLTSVPSSFHQTASKLSSTAQHCPSANMSKSSSQEQETIF